MSPASPSSAPLLVACLCAGWCGTCTSYQPVFDALAAEFGDAAQFVWVDIEDEADALGDVDVDDFPTLLIAPGGDARIAFFGPVLPHVQNARQLVQRALAGELTLVGDARLAAVVPALRRLG
jgi:thiol-disulfide isomerase/thioredoxin